MDKEKIPDIAPVFAFMSGRFEQALKNRNVKNAMFRLYGTKLVQEQNTDLAEQNRKGFKGEVNKSWQTFLETSQNGPAAEQHLRALFQMLKEARFSQEDVERASKEDLAQASRNPAAKERPEVSSTVDLSAIIREVYQNE